MPSQVPGPAKSGKVKPNKPSVDSRRSRSRNTTPISVSATVEQSNNHTYFNTTLQNLGTKTPDLDSIFNDNNTLSLIPSASKLKVIHEEINRNVVTLVNQRSDILDRVMRELSQKKKDNAARHSERERMDRARKEDEDRERRKKKKVVAKREPTDEERPLAIGAHGVARQDGIDVHKEPSSSISSPVSQAPPSAGTAPPDDAASVSGSEASHQPPPAPAVPRFQTFGPDPSKFDDPTIYHIRDVTPDMTDEEKREIFSVAVYPASDLHDKTCGTPPDKDFSNAKPTNQATFHQFTTYLDPYIRNLGEEDIAFLAERGDRVTPFVLPPRGPKHYNDIWTEEDVGMSLDIPDDKPPSYEFRGNPEMLAQTDITETDEVSVGPVMSRFLALLRPEHRSDDANVSNGDTNGDVEMEDSSQQLHAEAAASNGTGPSIPPATQLTNDPLLKAAGGPGNTITAALPKLGYANLDDRLLQELRHIGFLDPDETPQADWPGHYDDEIAARLRALQSELRKVSIRNGARKARILELTKDRMAAQEYNSIADDLDGQLNAAYLKRNRTIGKGKKVVKKPGGAGGGSHVVSNANGVGGVAKPGIGEPIRNLMDRRDKWMRLVGPVVNQGKGGIPKRTVFERSVMEKLEAKEEEGWNEQED